jgi:GT2 family glycosyltransferase
MKPRVRVVIVNTNDGAFVDLSIESALAQSVPCEIVMVDNESTDGSIERLRAAHPELKIVPSGGNRGYSYAASVGGFADTGERPEFLAMLNPDAEARPEWIERMTAWMDAEKIDVASSVVAGEKTAFFAGGRWLPFLGVAMTRYSYEGKNARWVSGCAVIVRTALFERLGGFDAGYFLYSEDVDFCLRAAAAGARVGVFEEPLVKHPEPGQSTNRFGSLRKHCIVMASKGRLVRRFSRGLALPTAMLFQLCISPALNGAALRDYPALARAFLEGFRSTSLVRAGE